MPDTKRERTEDDFFRLRTISDRLYQRALRQAAEDGDLPSHYLDHEDAVYLDELAHRIDRGAAITRATGGET